MHRLNLSDQKISAKFPFLVIIIQLCKDLHGKYNWGIQHESLRLMAEVEEEKFIQLSKFSDTRFANSKRRVFQNVLKMFHSICASLDADILADLNNLHLPEARVREIRERGEEARNMKGRLNNIKTVLELAGVSDIYEEFGRLVNISQMYRKLPHDRLNLIDESVNNLHRIALHFSTECSGDGECKTPYYHKAKHSLASTNCYNGVGVFDLHPGRAGVSSQTRSRQSQAAAEDDMDVLCENVETSLIDLTMGLFKDIRDEAIETKDRLVINSTKEILDVESLINEMIQTDTTPLAFSLAKYPEYRHATKKLKIDFMTIPESTLERQFNRFIDSLYKLYVLKEKQKAAHDRRNVFSLEENQISGDHAPDEEVGDEALDDGGGMRDTSGDGRHVFSSSGHKAYEREEDGAGGGQVSRHYEEESGEDATKDLGGGGATGDGRHVFSSSEAYEEDREEDGAGGGQVSRHYEEEREEDATKDGGGGGATGDGRNVFSSAVKISKSEEVWKRFFDENNQLYEGVETVLHAAAVAATKNSCESIIESFVSKVSKVLQME